MPTSLYLVTAGVGGLLIPGVVGGVGRMVVAKVGGTLVGVNEGFIVGAVLGIAVVGGGAEGGGLVGDTVGVVVTAAKTDRSQGDGEHDAKQDNSQRATPPG